MDGVESGVDVAIALGSNVGDRRTILNSAIDALRPFVRNLRASSFYDTPYVGTELERLLLIEQKCGRTRPYGGAPRTLDLDLILYGDSVIDEPGLIGPHPRCRERRFVLEPLAEIAGAWRDPVSGQAIRELLARLPD